MKHTTTHPAGLQWASANPQNNMTYSELQKRFNAPGSYNLTTTAGFQVDPHLVQVLNHQSGQTFLESLTDVIGFFGGPANLDATQVPLEMMTTVKALGANQTPTPVNLAQFIANYLTAVDEDTVDQFLMSTFTNWSPQDLVNYKRAFADYQDTL